MPKLKTELQFELTPEQYELALPLFERLEEFDGGMILGSIVHQRNGNFEVRAIAGFRLVDEATALKLIEIANGEGENEDA